MEKARRQMEQIQQLKTLLSALDSNFSIGPMTIEQSSVDNTWSAVFVLEHGGQAIGIIKSMDQLKSVFEHSRSPAKVVMLYPE